MAQHDVQGNHADAVEKAALRPLSVTDLRGLDIGKSLAPGTEHRQPMAGFDPDYVDIVDYILRCTLKIWEDKNVGLIYTHYLQNSVVHAGDGVTRGREEMVADTIHTLTAYPDDDHFADDVIWTGNDRDGFYTSHRFMSVGRNLGPSMFGPPTNRLSNRGGLALCYVKENRIIEEWIARDELGALRRRGYNSEEIVARLAEEDRHNPRAAEVHGEIGRITGQTVPTTYPPKQGDGFDVNDLVLRTMHDVWNWRMLGRINELYPANYLFHGAAELYGRGDYMQWVLQMMSAFPDGHFIVDQLFSMDDGDGNYRTSMRWSLLGTHTGYGMFGAPTNVPCRVWGLTQHYIRDGRFAEEYTYFNEMALAKRLYLARNGGLPNV